MGYDQEFYKTYTAYLNEPTVRNAHDFVFTVAGLNEDFRKVIDFGCGMFNEFHKFANPDSYIGIDLNVSQTEPNKLLIQKNYRDIKDLKSCIGNNDPTAFVSLFSTEITAPTAENYAFYERIFRELPSINSGLVSGFYYASQKEQNPIKETGGIVSYQALENIEDVQSAVFSESRITLPVPSKMFGADVFEVWKFLKRKDALAKILNP